MENPQGKISKNEVKEAAAASPALSRYESQKKRDWNTFGQYLKNHRPPLALSRCSGAHVLEFLRYLDQFGKTKVHNPICPFFGHPAPPAPCSCPLKQAWGSLDALVGRLRAAFEENGGQPEANPFGARAVRLYLRDVREQQAKARGIAYEKKRRSKSNSSKSTASSSCSSSIMTSALWASPSGFSFESVPVQISSSSPSLVPRAAMPQNPGFYHHLDHVLVGAPISGGEEISFAGGSTMSLSVLN